MTGRTDLIKVTSCDFLYFYHTGSLLKSGYVSCLVCVFFNWNLSPRWEYGVKTRNVQEVICTPSEMYTTVALHTHFSIIFTWIRTIFVAKPCAIHTQNLLQPKPCLLCICTCSKWRKSNCSFYFKAVPLPKFISFASTTERFYLVETLDSDLHYVCLIAT